MKKDIQIHQFVSNLTYGDAISNEALSIQKFLKSQGYGSKIFGLSTDPKIKENYTFFNYYSGNPNNIVMFHASLGGTLFDFIRKLPDKKIMIYHNITPACYFKPYNSHVYNLLKHGRERIMKKMRDFVDLALGDSDFNANELRDWGFKNTDVLPILLDFKKYDGEFNKKLYDRMKKGDTKNILFVGRFSPNKKQDDVLKAFYIYNKYFESDSRLILVGEDKIIPKYYLTITKLIEKLGLEQKVVLAGRINFKDLLAYYKSADLFLSMSEHEGFLVPVLESFYLDVPVLAFNAAAVPETMGKGGVLFDRKKYDEVAYLMDKIISDKDYRANILSRQKERLRDFSSKNLEMKLKEIIEAII